MKFYEIKNLIKEAISKKKYEKIYYKYWLISNEDELLFNRYSLYNLKNKIIIEVVPQQIKFALPWQIFSLRFPHIKNLIPPKKLNPVQLGEWYRHVFYFDYNDKNIYNIIDGSWDLEKNLVLFEENLIIDALNQVYTKNKAWEETAYYDYFKNFIYHNEEFLKKRIDYNNFLFEKMKKEGYKNKNEIIIDVFEQIHPESPVHLDDEIRVAIGRSGNIVFIDGNHRLAIAKFLNYDIIPVRIALVHPKLDFHLFLTEKCIKSDDEFVNIVG